MTRLPIFIALMFGVFMLSAAQEDDAFFPPDANVTSQVTNAPHTFRFVELAERRPLTLVLYDLTGGDLLAGIDINKQMPVVSAIKGPILLYFFYHVPDDVWNRVPVEYWNARSADSVSSQYLEDWETHRTILRDLYRMIVFSDNASTGNALLYAYEFIGRTDLNPIQAFNAWSQETIGVSPESGIREWDEGATNNPTWIEPTYNDRLTTIYGRARFYNNTFSALDMARYFYWLATDADEAIYARAVDLMSIVEGFPNFMETMAFNLEATPVSKDGFVGPGDRNNTVDEYLTADAGLVLLPDRTLLIVTMAVDGGDRLDEVYNEIELLVRQDRGDLYWPSELDYVTWMRSDLGPFGVNDLSSEGLYFMFDYLAETGDAPLVGEVYNGDKSVFDEARSVWLSIFPGDVMPSDRTPEQSRVLAVRYGSSEERLRDIAIELGLVEGE